jgi:hypothetical protein
MTKLEVPAAMPTTGPTEPKQPIVDPKDAELIRLHNELEKLNLATKQSSDETDFYRRRLQDVESNLQEQREETRLLAARSELECERAKLEITQDFARQLLQRPPTPMYDAKIESDLVRMRHVSAESVIPEGASLLQATNQLIALAKSDRLPKDSHDHIEPKSVIIAVAKTTDNGEQALEKDELDSEDNPSDDLDTTDSEPEQTKHHPQTKHHSQSNKQRKFKRTPKNPVSS